MTVAAQTRQPQLGDHILYHHDTPRSLGAITHLTPTHCCWQSRIGGHTYESRRQDMAWNDHREGWNLQTYPPGLGDLATLTVGQYAPPSPRPVSQTAAPAVIDDPRFPPTAAQFDRLLALLALTPQERAFVCAALKPDAPADLFEVLADYLEGQGRPASFHYRKSEAVRREREACARLVEGYGCWGDLARSIRARGEGQL